MDFKKFTRPSTTPSSGGYIILKGFRGTFRGYELTSIKIEDAEKAYSFAAPYIKLRFDNSDVFMKMVKENYEPVSNPKDFYFLKSKVLNGDIYHQVQIISQSNKIYIATYSLTLTGSDWKISGCALSLMDQKSV